MGRPDHVGFARLDRDRIVFLDIRADRYGCLSPALALDIIRIASGLEASSGGCERLVAAGLLLRDGSVAIWPDVPRPSVSALDGSSPRGRPVRFLAARWLATRLRLRWLGLASSLAVLRRLKSSDVLVHAPATAAMIARAFAYQRSRLPVRRVCLPDGLLLSRILLRQGLDCRLVFGVRLDPFAAHCWVMAGDCLLSDRLDAIREFVPIYAL